jgi:hypothetical protein
VIEHQRRFGRAREHHPQQALRALPGLWRIMMSQPIRISVRAAPGAIAWHIPTIKTGDPFAEVNVNRSTFNFPDADTNDPSPLLREWMTQSVREAVERDRLKRWIMWPDQSVTSFVDRDLTPHLKPAPSRDNGDQHAR